jgi:hypothetical protein
VAASGIIDLQELLAGYELAQVSAQDDLTFHLLFEGPGDELLLSVRFDETAPDRLACVGLSV